MRGRSAHLTRLLVRGQLMAMAKRDKRKRDQRKGTTRADPGNLRVLLERGLGAEQRGALAEAAKLFADAVRAAPDDPDALHLAGINARRRGKLAESAALLHKAVAARPADPRHHNALGITQSELGARDEAVRCFARAVELAPAMVEAHFNLAAGEEDRGRLEAAERGYRQTVALAPGLAMAHYNLGGVLLALKRPRDAADSLRAAIALRPDFPKALSNLGLALRDADPQALDEAAACQRQALELDATLVPAWTNLGLVLKEQGDNDEALRCFERALGLDPSHPTASHMVAALTSQTTARPPDGYVAQLFDGYADKFDAALLDGLNYAVPRRIAQLVEKRFGERRFSRAIDLGCGTGLMGVELRARVDHMVGVDLSPKMIDKARERAIYDELIVDDIEVVLRGDGARYDLIVAADVLVYLGDLSSLFGAVRDRLTEGGAFAFTTERAAEVDYVLRDTCRYAHGRDHLERLARANGMRVVVADDVVLRQQHGEPVDGTLSLLFASDAR